MERSEADSFVVLGHIKADSMCENEGISGSRLGSGVLLVRIDLLRDQSFQCRPRAPQHYHYSRYLSCKRIIQAPLPV